MRNKEIEIDVLFYSAFSRRRRFACLERSLTTEPGRRWNSVRQLFQRRRINRAEQNVGDYASVKKVEFQKILEAKWRKMEAAKSFY